MTRRDFNVSLEKLIDQTQETTSIESFYEETVEKKTASAPSTRWKVTVLQDLKLPAARIRSLTPNIFSVEGDQLLKNQNGIGKVQVSGYSGSREYSVNFDDPTPAISYRHTAFTPGSLANHCTQNVIARLQGKSQGGAHQNIYVDGGTHGPTVAQCFTQGFNPNSIVSGLDLNCISFGRNNPDAFVSSRHRFPGLLVGPRHIIGAHHCIPSAGQNCIFRRGDGSFFEANVIYDESLGFDMGIAMLDRDVTGIEFATILPPTYKQKLKAGSISVTQEQVPQRSGALLAFGITSNTSPNLGFVRHAQVFGITDIGEVTENVFFVRTQVTIGQPNQEAVIPFYSPPYGGDSGSPMFLVIEQNGVQRPVFLGSLFTAHTMPSYVAFSQIAQAKFNEVGPSKGYALPFSFRYADLSAFPDV